MSSNKNKIAGLTIQIDGDMKPLSTALRQADNSIKSTQKYINDLRKGLDIKWDNKEFIKAQELAAQRIDETKKKIDYLKQAIEKVESSGDTSTKAQKQIQYLNNELSKTELAAKIAKAQLEEIDNLKLDRAIYALDTLSGKMAKWGVGLTAGVTTPLILLGKQALETASQLTEVQNVVDVSFGESAQVINQWSQNLIEPFGLSELAAKRSAGAFKAMGDGMGVIDEEGQKMAIGLTERAADLASFYNTTYEVAETAMHSIYTSETETLKRFGVIMTEANLQAYATAQGYEKLYREMSQAEKVALRYNFVMDTTQNMQGDFARTSDSYANQQRIVNANFEKLSADLAQNLIPIMTRLLETGNDIIGWFNDLDEGAQKTLVNVLLFVAAIGPITTAASGLIKAIEGMAKAYKTLKPAIDAATASQSASGKAMSAIPYAASVAGCFSLIAAMGKLYESTWTATNEAKKLNDAIYENIDAYNSNIAGIEEQNKKSLAQIETIDQQINRFEELTRQEKLTADQKKELQGIISELNQELGTTISMYDIEKGKAEDLINTLNDLSESRRNEINLIAIRNRAIAAQQNIPDWEEQITAAKEGQKKLIQEAQKTFGDEAEKFLSKDSGFFGSGSGIAKNAQEYQKLQKNIEELENKIEQAQKDIEEYENFQIPNQKNEPSKFKEDVASFESKKKDLDRLRSLDKISEEQYYNDLIKAREQYLASGSDEWYEVEIEYHQYQKQLLEDQKRQAEERKEALEKQISEEKAQREAAREQEFSKAKDDLDYKLAMDLITQEQFYNELSALQSKYLEKDSAEWRNIEKQKYQYQKQLLEEARKAEYEEQSEFYKNKLEAAKEALQKEYDAEIEAIDKAYEEQEKITNQKIKLINEEIAARKRLKEEAETDDQIAALEAQLQYDKLDNFTRAELEAQLNQLKEEKAEREWEQEQERIKEQLEAELEAQKELDDAKKDSLKEAYDSQIERLNSEYEKNLEYLQKIYTSTEEQFAKIAENFGKAIEKGISDAMKSFDTAINNQKIRQSTGTQNYYDAKYNFIGTGYTPDQIVALIKNQLYYR